MKLSYKISGLDCESCAKMLELDLEDLGVSAKCDFAGETLEINNPDNIDLKIIESTVTDSGYKITKIH